MADALLHSFSPFLANSSNLPVLPLFLTSPSNSSQLKLGRKPTSDTTLLTNQPRRSSHLMVHAVVTEADQPKWWEKNAGPNMIDVHSTEELISTLSQAGDKLVIVEFYGTWCASCRALFPKFQKIKDAIAKHNAARCSIGSPVGVGDPKDHLDASAPKDKPAGAGSR